MHTWFPAVAGVVIGAGTAFAGVSETYFAEAVNIDVSAWNGGSPLPGNPALQAVADARSNFLANFSSIFEEDFEAVPLGTPGPSGTTLNFGPISATLTGPGQVRQSPPGLFGRFATSGQRYFDTQANPNTPEDSSPPFTVTFSSPITDFGFYATDVGDFGGQIELRLNDQTTTVINLPNSTGAGGSTDPSILFFGFISEHEFDEIVFLSTAEDADGFGFDDMLFGTRGTPIIPLPGAAMMGLAGLAGVASRRRR